MGTESRLQPGSREVGWADSGPQAQRPRTCICGAKGQRVEGPGDVCASEVRPGTRCLWDAVGGHTGPPLSVLNHLGPFSLCAGFLQSAFCPGNGGQGSGRVCVSDIGSWGCSPCRPLPRPSAGVRVVWSLMLSGCQRQGPRGRPHHVTPISLASLPPLEEPTESET